jgi:hypothetical protein
MNIPTKFWNVATVFVIVMIVAAGLAAIRMAKSIAYVGVNPTQTNTINVNGTGDAVAIPDVATFSFSVTQTAKTVTDAQTAATTKINAAIKAVKNGGVADKDIQTIDYSINPHYEYQTAVCPNQATSGAAIYCPSGKQVLTGYDVSESVQVKIRDLSKAGALFTTIGGLGVQNVNGLTFSVDDPDSVNAAARAKAISDAQSKASQLAKQLGVRLVRIVSFSENNNQRGPIAYGLGMMKTDSVAAAPATAPEIATGEQKVTDTVEIMYEIQ